MTSKKIKNDQIDSQTLLSNISETKPEETYLEKIKIYWESHKLNIILVFAGIIVIYLVFIRTGLLSRLFHSIKHGLDELHKTRPFTVFILLYLLVVLVVCTMIFSHAAICMLVATVLNNFWLALFLLVSASMTGSVLIFFLSKPLCAELILSKIDKTDYYIVLKKESKLSPWITAFGTRLLFIPAGSKDYILTMIDNPMLPFFMSCLLVHLFYILESCLIAGQLNELGEEHSKTWSEKTAVEKFFSLMIYFIIIFTIFLIVFLGKYVTNKINEKKLQQSEGIEMKDYADANN